MKRNKTKMYSIFAMGDDGNLYGSVECSFTMEWSSIRVRVFDSTRHKKRNRYKNHNNIMTDRMSKDASGYVGGTITLKDDTTVKIVKCFVARVGSKNCPYIKMKGRYSGGKYEFRNRPFINIRNKNYNSNANDKTPSE